MSKAGSVRFVVDYMGYVILVVVLALIYIFNAHASDAKMRKVQALKVERQDVLDKYMHEKQLVLNRGTASKLGQDLGGEGLGRGSEKPIVLTGRE